MVAARARASCAPRVRGRAARGRRAVCFAVIAALACGVLSEGTGGDLARGAWADDGSPPVSPPAVSPPGVSPPAGDLAEALRAAAIRMELALEHARGLSARGRRDEALAVLDAATKIHDELHARWRAGALEGAASAPHPPRPSRARRRSPQEDVAAAVDLDAARRYLLARQRPDGFFVEPEERLGEGNAERWRERREVEAGLVVAALCDLGRQRPLEAIRSAASALATASALRERPLHPIAAWGLASALTHVDEPGWRREVVRAVLAVMDASASDDPDDADGARAGMPAASRADVAWASLLLHEVLPMAGPSLAHRIEGQLSRWRAEARTTPARPDAAPEEHAARDLVAGLRLGEEGAHLRATPATSPSAFLSGSALLFYLAARPPAGDGVDALERVGAAQVRQGPSAGSWPPRPAAGPWGGRIAQTALHLLALRLPDTTFVSPVTRGLGG